MRQVSLSHIAQLLRTGKAGLAADSRRVRPGDVFVALPGRPDQGREDGARFIPDALRNGAVAVVAAAGPDALQDDLKDALSQAHDFIPPSQSRASVWAVSANPEADLGVLAQARYGTGDLPFPIIGVTGTNGKTTVTYLLEHLFRAAGRQAGVLGTVSYRWPGHEQDAPLTTPGLLDVHAMLAAMAEAGVGGAFMEVSSHALDQQRVAGVPFGGAVFTNLTQDHLDYHQTMDRYCAAKARLFEQVRPGGALAVNSDDSWGRQLLGRYPGALAYGLVDAGLGPDRQVRGTVLESGPDGQRLAVAWKGLLWEIASPLIGAFNALNLLAVQAVGLQLGFTPAELDCFDDFYGVSGRLERIPVRRDGRDLHVFVDYAHTPDALVNVLTALRGSGFGRIVTVFGCGGDRDRTKRPLMGRAVAEHADVAVLTSDNSRHEDPLAIMDDVLPGLSGSGSVQVVTEADRRRAIQIGLSLTEPGDVLLIAGKGHERTQQIGDEKTPFSDQDVVRELTCG